MPAPGTPSPRKPASKPEIRPATGINPATGEDIFLPTWASKISYYLRSRVTVTLLLTGLGFFGAKIGFQAEEAEVRQIVDSVDGIVLAVGWLLALIFNIRRRWTPPQ